MRFEGEDELPPGQVALAPDCGTGGRLARIGCVRFATFLVFGAVVFAFGAAAIACSGGSPASPTFSPTTTVVSEDAGSSAPGDGAGLMLVDGSAGSVTAAFERCAASPATGSFPADVAAILADKCQPCHTDPPKNGAPFPLLTYEDVQKPFVGTKPIYQQMYLQVQPGADPRMPFGNAPQLTPDEFSTLTSWLISCAPPGD
jgi:hypothetical protein